MDGISFDTFFGLFTLGCGLYCLYSFYMLKTKKKVSDSILLPKGTNIKKCKDLDGYCKAAGKPLLALGLCTTFYGAVDLYNIFAGVAVAVFIVAVTLFIGAIIAFVILTRKYNREYFDIK